jgi:hypothetical protein
MTASEERQVHYHPLFLVIDHYSPRRGLRLFSGIVRHAEEDQHCENSSVNEQGIRYASSREIGTA